MDTALFPDNVLDRVARALPGFLMRQRWYPAKDAGEPRVSLRSAAPLATATGDALLAVWDARPPGRPPLSVFVPVCVVAADASAESPGVVIGAAPAGGSIVDAMSQDDFVRALVAALLQSAGVAAAGAPAAGATRLECAHTAAAAAVPRPGGDAWRIRRSRAEQSNTSVRIGDDLILKVIRKLESGIHPELEMGRYLTEQREFSAVPALLAWADLAGCTVAILQRFVPNEGDGWSWVLARLRANSAAEAERAAAWIEDLGATTAALHLALARRTADPAFDPEPVRDADWAEWAHEIEHRARQVRDALLAMAADSHVDAATRAAVAAFVGRCDSLPGLLAKLRSGATGFAKTRHHGDYHLGQILVCGSDAVIVDFEGEPLRPLAERRSKQVALRDVAGMLRSIDYAAAAAAAAAGRTADGAAVDAPGVRLEVWAAAARQRFLERYLAAFAAGTSTAATARRVVQFFVIQKALYEVSYEMANRPEWLAIPLRGLAAAMAEPTVRRHRMPFGAEAANGATRFRLWAPGCPALSLELQTTGNAAPPRRLPMQADGTGWHELRVPEPEAGVGSRYRFVLPGGMRVPDPASRYQPEDVHGPSEVIDPESYPWQDASWQIRPWHEAVLYELHIGTFTPAGTFRAAIERLPHLVALGVTAIEIMPVADFPGTRNWGYDGVLLFAPDASYGRPEDLKALVDAAHAHGLMVLLDVVYNHFGPDGNYLPAYAPGFFTERHVTPWGAAVNFDGEGASTVREFVIHNALYWIEEFHLDGLRLDAVHAIIDDGARHVLVELAERVRALRPVHLVLENEENRASLLRRDARLLPQRYTAQWNDDVHHVLHVAATGELHGYYREYGAAHLMGRALAEGFAFQGETMAYRGTPRGEPSGGLPPTAFVAFAQNHDQIGNRACGERLAVLAPAAALRAVAALYLLLPQIPMLFMGEEWRALQPFAFFCDFPGELGEAVRQGRRLEFARFPEFAEASQRERIPDPLAEATFRAAKLVWSDIEQPAGAQWLDFHRRLLAVRRTRVVPLLPSIGALAGSFVVLGAAAVQVRWRLGSEAAGAELVLVANLASHAVTGPDVPAGEVLWLEGGVSATNVLDPWTVRWSLRRHESGA